MAWKLKVLDKWGLIIIFIFAWWFYSLMEKKNPPSQSNLAEFWGAVSVRPNGEFPAE